MIELGEYDDAKAEGRQDVEQEPLMNSYTVLGERFEVDARYEITEPLGFGAYGVVAAAKDTKRTKQPSTEAENLVAIKKIHRPFEQARFAQRTLRELKIQRLLDHENVVGIQGILKPRNQEDFKDIYVVLDHMETDLA